MRANRTDLIAELIDHLRTEGVRVQMSGGIAPRQDVFALTHAPGAQLVKNGERLPGQWHGMFPIHLRHFVYPKPGVQVLPTHRREFDRPRR
ncbi:hypothetical protein D3C84_912770 [compost metagenome]